MESLKRQSSFEESANKMIRNLTYDASSTTQDPPKCKIMHVFALSHKPAMDLTITLNGLDPELRFSTEESSFVLSKGQYLELYKLREEWLNKSYLANISSEDDEVDCEMTKMSSTKDELRFYREYFTQACPMDSEDVIYNRFQLNRYSTKKFIEYLPAIHHHVEVICNSRDAIFEMYESIAKIYVQEYRIQTNPMRLQHNFLQLVRTVGSYISPSKAIRDFNKTIEEKGLNCEISSFSLFSIASVQFDYLLKCVDSKL